MSRDKPPTQKVLSLYDYTTVFPAPWLAHGYDAISVDVKHPEGVTKKGGQTYIGGDVREYKEGLALQRDIIFVAAFPPCTDLAVSGARWFERKRKKNPRFQEEAMELLYIARDIAKDLRVPYFIENPVSVASTMWRKWDYTFHPYEYAGYLGNETEYYTKKTCLWTGGGFVMPPPLYDPGIEPDNRIHWHSENAQRAENRSKTPLGFSRAVFHANAPILCEKCNPWI
jgi:hypothetical protein